MNELKLCKTTVVRTLLPLAAVLVFFLVLLAAKALSVEGVSEYYELLTGAAAFAAAFFTVKEIFSLSVCCGVSRKTSFAAILICAFVTAFIVVAAHSIESFIFADKLKGTVIRLDGVAVDYTHAEILQNYSLLSLSFSKSAAYIYSMLFVRTFLIFFSGSAFFIIMSRLERTGKLINCGTYDHRRIDSLPFLAQKAYQKTKGCEIKCERSKHSHFSRRSRDITAL